jgi:hypothetical protein
VRIASGGDTMNNIATVPVRLGGDIRRVTDLQVQEGEEGRIAVELATTGRVGLFQGVEINFTHSDIPADEWSARPWWHVWADGEHHSGLIFPGEASAPDFKEAKKGVTRRAIYAKAGDRVTVGRVRQVDEVTFLHHPHDYGVRLAYLKLTRADGSIETDIGPLAFYGNTRIMSHGSREVFDNAVARIAAIEPKGFGNLSDPPTWKQGADHMAKYHAAAAHDLLFEMLDGLPTDDTSSYVRLRSLVNSAMLAGFALAKHEARRAERQAAGAARGAKAGGEKTADHVARQRAQELWAEYPEETVYWVAQQICVEHSDKVQGTVERSIKKLTPPTSRSYNPSKGYGK